MSAQSYNFTKSTTTYTELSNATSLTNGETWDDPIFTIPLGFDFTFYDSTLNTVYLTDFFLGGALATAQSSATITGIIGPFDTDLIDRSYDDLIGEAPGGTSDIAYKTEGNAGSRICKIQWKMLGFMVKWLMV